MTSRTSRQAAADRAPSAGAPYVGLVPYGEDDAAFFFGREQENADRRREPARVPADDPLRRRAASARRSLLQAGVVHDLREQVARQRRGRRADAVRGLRVPRVARRPAAGAAGGDARRVQRGARRRSSPRGSRASPLVETLRAWTDAVPARCSSSSTSSRTTSSTTRTRTARARSPSSSPRIVNDPNLRVNVLLSIREDAWAKLDRFEGRIPSLFANYLRVEHLDRDGGARGDRGADRGVEPPPAAGRAAVRRSSRRSSTAVLDAAAAGGSRSRDERRRGAPDAASADDDRGAVPPARDGAALARDGRGGRRTRSTLARARGARRRARRSSRTTCSTRSASSRPPSRPSPPTCFRFLVTRSKTKIAHPASDLAEWTGGPEPEVAAVLDKLCRGESGRILRAVARRAGRRTSASYELFHDVLAEPILEWRSGTSATRGRGRGARQRVVRRRFVRIGGVLVDARRRLRRARRSGRSEEQRRRARDSVGDLARPRVGRDDQLASHLDVSLLLGLEAYRARSTAEARAA